MIQIRHERLSDIDAREALLDNAFGESRYRKSSERPRERQSSATATMTPIGTTTLKRARSQWLYLCCPEA